MQSSVQYRNQGNRKFRASQKKCNGLSVTEQYALLQQAEYLYKQAEAVACGQDEVGSALKNLGICQLKLSEYEKQDAQTSIRLRAAQNVLMEAYRSGIQSFKDQQWIINTLQYLVQVGQAMGKLGKSKQDALLFEGTHWKKLFLDLKFDQYFVISFILESVAVFVTSGLEVSMQVLESQSEIKSKNILVELDWLLNEANTLAGQQTQQQECIDKLIRRRLKLLSIVDSHIARKKGMEIFDQLVKQKDNIEFQGRRAEDYFQEARALSKGRCLLAEGNALSCLGLLLWKVFKNEQSSLKALQLCVSLDYSSAQMVQVSKATWYISAKGIIKEIQMMQQRNMRAGLEQRRVAYLERSGNLIQQLHDSSTKGALNFVQYIYQQYPPSYGQQIQINFNQNQKKVLLQAVKQYHPDKQHGRKEEDIFIFEEISKILNNLISNFR